MKGGKAKGMIAEWELMSISDFYSHIFSRTRNYSLCRIYIIRIQIRKFTLGYFANLRSRYFANFLRQRISGTLLDAGSFLQKRGCRREL